MSRWVVYGWALGIGWVPLSRHWSRWAARRRLLDCVRRWPKTNYRVGRWRD